MFSLCSHGILGVVFTSGVWRSLVTCGDECSDTLEIHGLNPCGKGAEEDAVEFTTTFPDTPCVSQMSGLSLRLGIPREWLSIPPRSGKVVKKNAG